MDWYYYLITIGGSFLLGLVFLFLWYFRYITPLPTGVVTNNVSAIKSGIVNAFIYSKGSDRILIDTGTNTKKIQTGFAELGIELNSVDAVFFTHGDPDHVGGNALFEDVQFYIGQESKVKEYERYIFVDDRDIIEIGEIKILAISAPGHRLGHTIYQIDDEYLFTGDALRLKKGKATPFLRMISSDYDTQVKSIHMIADLNNIKYVFTAHNGHTNNFEEAFQEWKVTK